MKKTPEELRAMCIAAGIHPNAEGRMPRNVWALVNKMNELLGSGEPVAYRVVWSADAPAAMRSFYSADEMAYQRANVEWLGGKAVPLFDAPQPVPPPAEPTEEMCNAGEREVASGRMARYQDWADFCGQIYRAMVKVALRPDSEGSIK